jgi:hypothetical protein
MLNYQRVLYHIPVWWKPEKASGFLTELNSSRAGPFMYDVHQGVFVIPGG